MIKLFSTYTKDIITNNGNEVIKDGGPALFMKNVFSKNDIEYKIYAQEAIVKIVVKDGDEKGVLQNSLNKKILQDINKDDVVAISTVSNEWIFDPNAVKENKVFLDAQGYIRYAKENPYFFEENFWDDIFCLKVNEQELKYLPHNIIDNQKAKCLIVTKGNIGVDVYTKNKKIFFNVDRIESSDTIGAGDTFFANFIVSFIKMGDTMEKNINFAINETEEFLLNKKL